MAHFAKYLDEMHGKKREPVEPVSMKPKVDIDIIDTPHSLLCSGIVGGIKRKEGREPVEPPKKGHYNSAIDILLGKKDYHNHSLHVLAGNMEHMSTRGSLHYTKNR